MIFKKPLWILIIIGVIAVLAIAKYALASQRTTEQPAVYELHSLPDNKIVPGDWPKDAAACRALADSLVKAGKLVDFSCVTRQIFKTTATCADEPAPTIALVQKAQEGSKYWEIPTVGATDPPPPSESNDWAISIWVYVPNPAGDGAYPNCWIRGWAPESTWRVNPNYPKTPILERRVEGMADISEPPNSIEPVCKPDGPADCPA